MSEYEGRHARPRQPGPAAAWLRSAARDTWALIRLIPVIPVIFRRVLPRAAAAPAPGVMDPAQEPRPADPQRRGGVARCGPGQPPLTPGAVCADDGTGTGAGGAPPPAAAATTPPGGAATLPPAAPPRDYPGRGQHPYAERPAWVTYAGDHPMPGYRGDYRPTQPMRAAGGTVACNIFRPFYPELERWRDSTARWGA